MLGDGILVIKQTGVRICPAGYAQVHEFWRTMYLHEFGHAVGLGHVGRFHGRLQEMSPVATTLRYYRAGDVNGLRAVVANTALGAASGVIAG